MSRRSDVDAPLSDWDDDYATEPTAQHGAAGDAGEEPEVVVFHLASFALRAAGLMIDLGLYFVIVYAGVLATALLGVDALAWITQVAAYVFLVWNYVWRLGRTGQTLGKQAVGIQLVSKSDAKPIGWLAVLTRHVAHLLDCVTVLGWLWPIFDRNRQTLADKLLRTVVIEAPRRLMR